MTNITSGHRSTPRAVVPAYRYVKDDAALIELMSELSRVDRYGIDTEFVRERTYYARLALVQISWQSGIALVDPEHVDITLLRPLLASSGLAILHAADQDLEVLDRACGVVPDKIFDTQLAAGFIGMSTPSLLSLVESLLNLRLEKGDQLTDWSRRPLGESQLRYAAGDVAFLLDLHDVLTERLRALGRLEWAESECQELQQRPHSPVEPEEVWWRMKHARQLRGRSRCVAQTVAAWRERRAQVLDIPARYVLSDLALASIAQRPPTAISELEQVRSLESRHLSGGVGEELMRAINEGVSMPREALHQPPAQNGDSAPKASVMLTAAWVNERAHELNIDPTLLATRADLANYLRDLTSGRIATTWRAGVIGEPIRRLVAGDAALALEGGARLVLEERTRKVID